MYFPYTLLAYTGQNGETGPVLVAAGPFLATNTGPGGHSWLPKSGLQVVKFSRVSLITGLKWTGLDWNGLSKTSEIS